MNIQDLRNILDNTQKQRTIYPKYTNFEWLAEMEDSAQIRERIGLAMRRLRSERHLTLADVAKGVGVSSASVSLWELGKSTPSAVSLWALADYYGVPVAEVMGKVEVTTREIIPSSSPSSERKPE